MELRLLDIRTMRYSIISIKSPKNYHVNWRQEQKSLPTPLSFCRQTPTPRYCGDPSPCQGTLVTRSLPDKGGNEGGFDYETNILSFIL